MDSTSHQPHLIILSGPSGAGKSTVIRQLLKICPLPIALSVSATTRPPRSGETEGVDYHFLSDQEFQSRRIEGEFLECMEVFGRGYWYGTLKSSVATGLEEGKWVLLEIDVQGAMSVLDQFPSAITLFIDPGSPSELETRLRQRGTETESSLHRRLEVARSEMEFASRYQHTIINRAADEAADEISRILMSVGDH